MSDFISWSLIGTNFLFIALCVFLLHRLRAYSLNIESMCTSVLALKAAYEELHVPLESEVHWVNNGVEIRGKLFTKESA